MSKRGVHVLRLACVILCAAAFTGTRPCRAEGAAKPSPPEFPAYGELSNVRNQFLEIYIEGTKVGYTKWTVGETQIGGKRTFIVEEQTELAAGEGENVRTLSVHSRALADGNTMQLICAEETEKHNDFERYGFVRMENSDNGRVLKYYKKVGDNVEAWEEEVSANMLIYPEPCKFTAFALQLAGPPRPGVPYDLRSVSPVKGMMDSEKVTYLSKTIAKVDDKDVLCKSLETNRFKKLLLDNSGNIVVSISTDDTTVVNRSDEEKYNKMPGNLEGYKTPAFIDHNTATPANLGISIERPDKACFFKTESNAPIFSVEDGFEEGSVMGWAFDLVPDNASAADLAERFTKMLEGGTDVQDIRLGAPEESEINGLKGIAGNLTIIRHTETTPGRYRAVIKDGRGLVIFFSAPEALWKKNAEWRLGKIANTIKMLDKPKEEKPPELVRNVPELGVELTLPGKSWEFAADDMNAISARFPWDMISLTVNAAARPPEMTLDVLQQKIKESLTKPNIELKDLKPIKVSGLDAVLAEALVKNPTGKEQTSKIRKIYVLQQNSLVVLVFTGTTTFWEDAVPNMDKIIETIKVTEPVLPKEEETPPENTEQPPAPEPAPTPEPAPAPAPEPTPAPAPEPAPAPAPAPAPEPAPAPSPTPEPAPGGTTNS